MAQGGWEATRARLPAPWGFHPAHPAAGGWSWRPLTLLRKAPTSVGGMGVEEAGVGWRVGWAHGPQGSSPPSGHCMSPSCAVSAELAASWRSRGLPGPPWAASSGSTLSSFWLPLASCYEVIHTASVWSLGRNCEHMPRRSIRWLFAGLGEELRTAAPLALAQSCRKAPRPSRVLTRDSLVSPTGSTEAESIMRWGEAILTCLCSWLFRLSFPKSMKTRQAAISLSQLWTLASIKFP